MSRIGNGLDFHRLEINPERPLLLGGYLVPSELALVGHSDADIVLHAIADAILGALALGDIGEYFPDTNPDLKNMDSKIIIHKCLALMKEANYSIENLDVTIICEKPKISPHKLEIRKSLSNLLNVALTCVSVKATTTEKMGALGRSEGVGVLVTILLN
jgi:2-C-methyl-D-erythritol 2,4-cyclodiphosphate synthase